MSKKGGSREKWEKFRNIGTIFRNRKSRRRREPLWKGAGTGSAGCGRREVPTPLSPLPATSLLKLENSTSPASDFTILYYREDVLSSVIILKMYYS